MVVLPQWARKPKYKKEVVATSRGWIVKDTGEILKVVRDLDQRLIRLEKDAIGIADSVVRDVEVTEELLDDNVSAAIVSNSQQVEEVSGDDSEDEKEDPVKPTPQQKKKPGRKPKSQNFSK